VAELSALRSVAGHFGFEIIHHPIQGPDDIAGAVAASKAVGVEALYVSGEPLLLQQHGARAAVRHGVGKATVGTYPEWGRAGLLMSYSPICSTTFAAPASSAKILGGEKPGDLPIEQGEQVRSGGNVKTAKTSLALACPPTLLTLAMT